MHTRKLAAAILAILAIGIIAPAAIPRGHADDSSESIVSTGYAIRGYNDPYLGTTVDALKAGSVLAITVGFHADNQNMQRNVSLGIKFDWMNSYQNSSMANWQAPYSVFANQWAYLTLNFTVPNLTGQYSGLSLTPHNWKVQVWNGPLNKAWNLGCGTGYTSEYYNYTVYPYKYEGSCHEFDDYSVAVYSSQQSGAVNAKIQANAEITTLSASLRSVLQAPPGSSNAIAQLAAANVQITLGDQAYSNGDFNGANSDYQNALNDANAAQASLATTGGGTDTATLTSIWIQAVAILFGGIGALLVGFAGFKYLRGRTRMMSGYTPATSPKA